MNTELAKTNGNGNGNHAIAAAVEAALVGNDLSKLSTNDRISYYNRTCESLGLNPLTQPFAYITLNGKLTLYAKRDCTEQLRKIHSISIEILSREQVGDVYLVRARGTTKDGRCDESLGAVTIGNLKGDNLANALMKAETKAKRRVTLSIVGLGWLDETEIETIPDAKPSPAHALPELELGPNYAQQLEPPQTSIESLDNPWLHVMEKGKFKGSYVLQLPAEVLGKAEIAYRQNRITESDYVNCRDAILNEHLKNEAFEQLEMDRADAESLQAAIKGGRNE